MGLESSRLRMRMQVIAAGVWVTYLLGAAMAVWVVVTWDRPYRGPIAVLVAAARRAIADRTVAALAERIGAAAGVACHPADGRDGEALHRHVDADLYAVKAHLRS
jgi:predicted signal transduction protein with EAL and GGDEF domain